jgi:SecD/SecF fusion protein
LFKRNSVWQLADNRLVTTNEAQDLASILQSGKLPAPAKIVQEQVVGPPWGKEAVNGGAMAFLISFVVIFVLMLIYYNTAAGYKHCINLKPLIYHWHISAFGFTVTAAALCFGAYGRYAVNTNVLF